MIRRRTATLGFIGVVWLLLLATCPATAWGDTAKSCTSDSPVDIIQRRLQAAGVAAGALVVVRNGRIDYSGGFGLQTPDGQPR